jgi:Fe-S oxidoreductase
VPTLQVVALVLAVAATVLGLWAFTRGLVGIVRTVRRGSPAAGRSDAPGVRTATLLRSVLGHTRFSQRPMVRMAHWAVMVSFPVLFLTLVSGYAQLVDPRFVLPVLGSWPPYEWAVEVLAWLSLVGIVWLIATRQLRHPRRGEAAAGGPSAARRGRDGELLGPPGLRASRFFGSNAGQAYLVEGVVLGVVVAVLALRGLEYALSSDGWFLWSGVAPGTPLDEVDPWLAHRGPLPSFDVHFPLTAWFGTWLTGLSIGALETGVVVVALAKILLSMTWMVVVGTRPAMSVSWHRFLAVVNVWARRDPHGRPALGAAAPLRGPAGEPLDLTTLEDVPEDLVLGVGRVEDFTWKGLLDFSTCTECGRCAEQCPAWNTGKPLNPKLVVTALRDHAYATSPWLTVGANQPTAPAGRTSTTGRVPLLPSGAPASEAHADLDVLTLVGDVIEPDALWDCTMCGACVQQCPVDIEHVDHLLDLRRNQVLLAGAFPAELGQMFSKVERRGNPWGLPARQRMAWAKDLGFDVPVVGVDVEDAAAVDYLFWVGCAGAYDDRGKQVSRAVAELLHTAGVSFAVLGDDETCTGDPARRAGNEALFQQLAHAAIETLDAAGARRIVVTCAHCFNTIRNEYPQLGGHYEVVHHTELLDRLVGEGRLVPVRPAAAEAPAGADPAEAPALPSITYHDPCYLGRHNQVYSPPRSLLAAAGAQVTEMPRNGERSFCCGGGGARVWMEETRGRRIAADRLDEATATGADVVATACPFCTVMLTDAGRTAAGTAPVVRDVAEVLLDAVRPPAG